MPNQQPMRFQVWPTMPMNQILVVFSPAQNNFCSEKRAAICEKHFLKCDVIRKGGSVRLKHCAKPCLNLPKDSSCGTIPVRKPLVLRLQNEKRQYKTVAQVKAANQRLPAKMKG